MSNEIFNNYSVPYYGAHMSITNGIVSAISDINEISGNMIQIFLSSPMMLNSKIDMKKFAPKIIDQIKTKCEETNSKIVVHLPYVINLAKPLDINPLETKSIKIIIKQLELSHLIGSIGCVVHVGKYTGLTEIEGLENMYRSLKLIIDYIREHDLNTYIILETSAGQGTELLPTKNNSLNDLAEFYARFDSADKKHIKICVDTCHVFAAGYDLKEKGCIGIEGLRHFIRYAIYYKIPTVLETPSDYIEELNLINEVKNGVDNWINQKNNNT
jgi:deoxyribonuclease-4